MATSSGRKLCTCCELRPAYRNQSWCNECKAAAKRKRTGPPLPTILWARRSGAKHEEMNRLKQQAARELYGGDQELAGFLFLLADVFTLNRLQPIGVE